MRATPPSTEEIEVWLAVLRAHGHLHCAEAGPDGTWTVRRTPSSAPHTLHHPVLALDYIAAVLRDVRVEAGDGAR
ncbi:MULTISPECIES: hypothetical protein [unclassified Streptomyces]|uniref:hypothetical protein n=1 Tax=unclassified Streptomyces TaxID=2593676 RepID=UPI002DDBC508|nr:MULTISPECIES: hypothetical protein [unclassified Streptomyces]WSA96661.1 hypothetical protein OIE63_37745 [Streptomyces sp. NBC_01795]WSB81076.1 hypothetical protein OHB04_38865 [Streptomyces sp. NBC_01775]WSS10714.1 hypothetical protein OG533_01395 [Streptomyces sp. NBC_01186]WSS39409.1 hypothetical protein OG220_01420 [Streptomyces sp. NBC_01187]